ncbi:hypothetical protein GCM10027598_11060 [Amycolatopsis oliviviridis]|uniref:Uncharacterized protein n=1 Tax=Amycolatopsis oliviviridis TaxID=1471590 RepID=A0ABQ3LXV0_9PSEU|nr:hypothetical protein GCM10017790_55070 [Amycolatopsis oliviviridis]
MRRRDGQDAVKASLRDSGSLKEAFTERARARRWARHRIAIRGLNAGRGRYFEGAGEAGGEAGAEEAVGFGGAA